MWGIFSLEGARKSAEQAALLQGEATMHAAIWQDGFVEIGGARCLRHPASGLVLAARARLDNRSELTALPGLPPEGAEVDASLSLAGDHSETASDAAVILQAYLRWGRDCPQHFRGDWVFALWDSRERMLFLARDQCGISSLYYCRVGCTFAFASTLKELLALPGIPRRPHLPGVARVLSLPVGDPSGWETAYEGIYRLPAGMMLTVTAGGDDLRRYWFPENTPALRLKNDDAYVEACMEIYQEAVCCRLRSPLQGKGIGATLSSGLDSSSVCALAARALSAAGQALPVFTSVPLYDTQNTTPPHHYGDELPLVEMIRQFIGNLDLHIVRAEGASPLDSLTRGLDIYGVPLYGASNLYWMDALFENARQQGMGTVLIGHGGNLTISWAASAAGSWRFSPWQMLRRSILRPAFQEARRFWQKITGRQNLRLLASSPINSAWARDLLVGQPRRSADPDRDRSRLLAANVTITGSTWAEMEFAYGLDVRDPTMDSRLVEFCLSIPDEPYRMDGMGRALVRRTMKGLLPDEVRLNRHLGMQAADLGFRLLAELPQVQAALARLEKSEMATQVLDLPKMAGVLESLQAGVNVATTKACMSILMRGLMMGLFLAKCEGKGD